MADRLVLNENYSKEMVKAELPKFVARINSVVSEYMTTRFPNLAKEEVVIGGGRSVYGFVRAADGAILKAASWSAPALNFTRGNIFDESYAIRPYGVL